MVLQRKFWVSTDGNSTAAVPAPGLHHLHCEWFFLILSWISPPATSYCWLLCHFAVDLWEELSFIFFLTPLVGSWRQQSGAKLYACLSWILPRSYSLSRSPQWQPWPQHGDCPYSLTNLVSPINARRAHCSPWLRLLMKMLSSINPQDQHNFPFISLKKRNDMLSEATLWDMF